MIEKQFTFKDGRQFKAQFEIGLANKTLFEKQFFIMDSDSFHNFLHLMLLICPICGKDGRDNRKDNIKII